MGKKNNNDNSDNDDDGDNNIHESQMTILRSQLHMHNQCAYTYLDTHSHTYVKKGDEFQMSTKSFNEIYGTRLHIHSFSMLENTNLDREILFYIQSHQLFNQSGNKS